VIINFNISRDDNWLLIKISNNFDPEAPLRKGTGIGIKNIRNRLKLIYGNPDLLCINKGDDYFKVELVIPQTF
ncbi:MAG: hypothetical protein ACOCXH_08940, partial [Cyclobacteriaceae bacterium]